MIETEQMEQAMNQKEIELIFEAHGMFLGLPAGCIDTDHDIAKLPFRNGFHPGERLQLRLPH